MGDLGILFEHISDLGPKIKAREISPVEVTTAAIDHAERMQPVLNSFITLSADLALRQAQDLERMLMRGLYLGPLHGVPLGVKDMLLTKGIRTTDGGRAREHILPTEDAAVVERVRSAGAVILGKENMHELGFGYISDNHWYGRVRNPWDLERIAGGSGGGSAANVAAFVTYGSVGTDGGGSVRVPSAACGIVGLKPTFGRISIRGCLEGPDPSTYHVGPHTRSVLDGALMLGVMAGYDPLDPTTVPVPVDDYESRLGESVKGLVMGIPTNHFFDSPLDVEIQQAVVTAITTLESLGIKSRRVQIPFLEYLDAIGRPLDLPYCALYEESLRSSPDEISDSVRMTLLSSQFIMAEDFLRSQQLRRLLQEAFSHVMRKVDFLVTPTLPVMPWKSGAKRLEVGDSEIDLTTVPDGSRGSIMGRNTGVANLVGAPAISVPCGHSSLGLPIGLQLIGRPWEDGTLLRVAHQFEQAHPLTSRVPPAVEIAMGEAVVPTASP